MSETIERGLDGVTTTRSDSGQATVLAVGVVVMAVLAAIGLIIGGQRVVDAARAQAVADAVALAAVIDGEDAAHRVAAASGATVVSLERSAGDVVAEVEVGAARATARASDQPDP